MRILLIHGWRQSLDSWLPTARQLHKVLGHDVLLPDLFGHGKSPYLSSTSDLSPQTLVAQLRALVLHVGWDQSPIVLAGISLGGALAQLYSIDFPSNVDRLVLVASGGLSESPFHPIYAARAAAGLLVRWLASKETETSNSCQQPAQGETSTSAIAAGSQMVYSATNELVSVVEVHLDDPDEVYYTVAMADGRERQTTHSKLQQPTKDQLHAAVPFGFAHRVLSQLNLVAFTPEYTVPQDIIAEHLKQFPLTLVWGGCDVAHSAQLERRINGREDVNVLYVPLAGHLICSFMHLLKLEDYPRFWSGTHSSGSITRLVPKL